MFRFHGRACLLSLLAMAIFSAFAAGCAATVRADEPLVIEISAERFSFSPSEVRARTGTLIEFRLRSEDTTHGFHLLDTDVHATIPKRGKGVATVTFTPTNAGRYTFECSKLCGAGHSFMRGVLIVTD